MKKIVIAIDGYSACGKSSTAKQVAHELGYDFIDSGAMYRAATYFFLTEETDLSKPELVASTLDRCDISIHKSSVILNGVNIDDKIRSMEVNRHVSQVSAIPVVRRKMVAQQQQLGKNKGVVMDGRDIGTVVFPDAELKIFMIADVRVRAERRQKELLMKGLNEEMGQIIENLQERDRIDSTREDSPLRKAPGAIEIDTTHLTLDEQIRKVIELANERIHES